MNPIRFDSITRLLASCRTRRQALRDAGLTATALAIGGLETATAQDVPAAATPGVEGSPVEKTMYLFVQSFNSGSIVPTAGQYGRYTVTLEQGTGQTVYFGDRPSRDVGATPTPEFLQGLGFPEDDPPNAALIVETGSGETDIAVVELFNPVYDEATRGVTYDVKVMQNWREDVELGLREEPADLATLTPSFESAHLLIDDCPLVSMSCRRWQAGGVTADVGYFWHKPACWNYSVCMPCEPYGHNQPDRCATYNYWTDLCNSTFPECASECWLEYQWSFVGDGC